MPINAAIGSSLIGAGSSLLGGVMSGIAQNSANKTNLQIARENNAANQQLQSSQNAWNLDQWNRENTYNSASSQKQRLLDAGYNPQLASGQVATGSATSSQLTSAPYTPNQQVQVQPVNYAAGLSNAGNDFVSSYMNMRMMSANVKKAEAEADNALANAAATSGYKKDTAVSEINRNNILNDLTKTQTESNDIQNKINQSWGNQIKLAELENLIAQRQESISRRNLNEKTMGKVIADTAQSYAKAKNLNVSSSQMSQLTPLLVRYHQLQNTAQGLQNNLLKVDSDWETQYGSAKRSAGFQGLYHDSNIKKKDDQYYWPSKGLNAIGTAKGIGKTLKYLK